MDKFVCNVLMVDDDEEDYLLVRAMLAEVTASKFELHWAATDRLALEALGRGSWDALLVDYVLGEKDGPQFLREIGARKLGIPVILITGKGSYDKDLEAMQAGAVDFLSKNEMSPPLLERALRYAIDRKQTEEYLERRVRERTHALEESNNQLAATNQELLKEIVDRKQAEAQLARQASLMEQVKDAIIATDKDFRITAWNRAAEDIYGWRKQEVVGLTTSEILRTEYQDTDQPAAIKKAQETGHFQGEAIQYRKDGQPIFMEVQASVLRDETGQLTGFVSVNHDITERKQAEQRRQQQLARAQAASELSQMLAEARLDTQKIVEIITRRVAGWIGDACVITLLSEDGQWLLPAAFHHPQPEALELLRQVLPNKPARVGESSSGWVAQTGEALMIPEVAQEQVRAVVKPEYWPYLDRFGVSSMLIVPLKVQEKVIGTLGITRDLPGPPYTLSDQAFLISLADRAALSISKANLYQALQAELVERKRVEAELIELKQRLMDHIEAERVRLSQDLHDGPIQDLIGVSYQLKTAQEKMPDQAAVEDLEEIQKLILRVGKDLRMVCSELRPPTLDVFGLEKTIRSHAERYQEEHPEIQVGLDLASDRQMLPEKLRLGLYRIYQEAMSNIWRHAQARSVQVVLNLDAEQVYLEIQDDGQGFALQERFIYYARKGHLGLAGMVERAEAIGGTLRVETKPGQGTLVRVVVPRSSQV